MGALGAGGAAWRTGAGAGATVGGTYWWVGAEGGGALGALFHSEGVGAEGSGGGSFVGIRGDCCGGCTSGDGAGDIWAGGGCIAEAGGPGL